MWKDKTAFFGWCEKNRDLKYINQVKINGIPVLLLDNARGGYYGCRLLLSDPAATIEEDKLSKLYARKGYYCAAKSSYSECRTRLLWYLRFSPTIATDPILTYVENKVYGLFQLTDRPIYSGDVMAIAKENGLDVKNIFLYLHRLEQKKFIKKIDSQPIESENHPAGRGRTPSVFYQDNYPTPKG